jgi:flagellar biosynthesis protein FlhG
MASTFGTPACGRYGEPGASAPGPDRAGFSPLYEALPDRRVGAPRIWAVGGGKGGVGKSVVTSNLAAAMALSGRRCAVIDADLGGANLHTLLGVSRPRYSLSHLLTGDVASLAELMVQTPVPRLWLVSGNQALLEMANPGSGQKERLFRQIRGLDVDEVVLDLSAGSAFNVLDFFLLARRGLVVVTPEPTAIENAEHFLKAAFYRSLRKVARRPDVRAVIRRLREHGTSRRVRSAGELIALVRAIDPPAAKPLEECAQSFAPLLLVNQVQTPEHRRVGPQLVTSCRELLGVAIEFAGSVDFDPNVAAAVAMQQPVLLAFPLSRFSRHIEALAERLQRRDRSVPRERSERDEPAYRRGAHGGASEPSSRPRPLPPLDRVEPGAYLRRCREALGLTLAEMTERTRIRGLDHIESERFEHLPPEPYLKGYLLEYARELGVPEIAELAKSYLAKCPPPGAVAPARAPQPTLVRGRRFGRWRG